MNPFRYKKNFVLIFGALSFLGIFPLTSVAEKSSIKFQDSLLGPKVNLHTEWVGLRKVSSSLDFLILAGHADSQGIGGAGTSGAAVDLNGEVPMDSLMSDELYWNLMLCKAIVHIGELKGLNISFYDPGVRNIIDGNHPQTNWSVGAKHANKGGYPLEIHFDSYGDYGFGSGLIPAISRDLNLVDESLANSFGRYPMFFRGGLGAPRRGIRVLEIGKLEGKLEAALRNPKSREKVINNLAQKIVDAFVLGVQPKSTINPLPDKEDISH